MASVFEVGRCYTFYDSGFAPMEVLKRTDKTVWVRNESNAWRMRIRHDADGEYAIDSSEPRSWSDIFTVHSKYKKLYPGDTFTFDGQSYLISIHATV